MSDIYEDGTYLNLNRSWHQEDSPWKAQQILKMIRRNSLVPVTLCEVGCGAGEVLNQLAENIENAGFYGYDISPQAISICEKKSRDNLSFYLKDVFQEESLFDVVMAIDVFEHVEDYFGFLRKLKLKGDYKIFHIPLDLSVQTVLRSSPILRGRRTVGHLHYFTKETALETLKDTGYEILDYFYTSEALDLPNRGWKRKLLSWPRRLSYAISQDMAVRILGGWSLLVLAK